MIKISRRSAILGLVSAALSTSVSSVFAQDAVPDAAAPLGDVLDLPFGFALEGGEGAWPGKANLVLSHLGRHVGQVAQAATRVGADGKQQLAAHSILVDTDPVAGGLLASLQGFATLGSGGDLGYFQIKTALVGLRPSGALASKLGIPDEALEGPVLEVGDVTGRLKDGDWTVTAPYVELESAVIGATLPIVGSLIGRLGFTQFAMRDVEIIYVSRGGGDAARTVTLNGALSGILPDGNVVELAHINSSQNIASGEAGYSLLSGNLSLTDAGLTGLLQEKGGDLVFQLPNYGMVLAGGLMAAGWAGPQEAKADADALIAFIGDGGRLVLSLTPSQPVAASKLASYSPDLGGIRQFIQETGARIERREV